MPGDIRSQHGTCTSSMLLRRNMAGVLLSCPRTAHQSGKWNVAWGKGKGQRAKGKERGAKSKGRRAKSEGQREED